jgi:hypothetical protein
MENEVTMREVAVEIAEKVLRKMGFKNISKGYRKISGLLRYPSGKVRSFTISYETSGWDINNTSVTYPSLVVQKNGWNYISMNDPEIEEKLTQDLRISIAQELDRGGFIPKNESLDMLKKETDEFINLAKRLNLEGSKVKPY